MVKKCTKCGAENPKSAAFCQKCGAGELIEAKKEKAPKPKGPKKKRKWFLKTLFILFLLLLLCISVYFTSGILFPFEEPRVKELDEDRIEDDIEYEVDDDDVISLEIDEDLINSVIQVVTEDNETLPDIFFEAEGMMLFSNIEYKGITIPVAVSLDVEDSKRYVDIVVTKVTYSRLNLPLPHQLVNWYFREELSFDKDDIPFGEYTSIEYIEGNRNTLEAEIEFDYEDFSDDDNDIDEIREDYDFLKNMDDDAYEEFKSTLVGQ